MAGVIRFVGFAVAFVIAIGIALVCLDAREEDLVAVWLDVTRFLTDPFRDLVDLESGREHLQIAINWGIAAALYLLAALMLSRFLIRGRVGRRAAH